MDPSSTPLPIPPRNVRLTRLARRNLFFALLISLFGVVLVLFLVDRSQKYERRRARVVVNGPFVEGKVVKKSSRRDTSNSPGSITVRTTYHVDYEFNAEGQKIHGIGRVGKSLWDELREGGPVGVYYVPNNPSVHQLSAPGEEQRQQTAKYAMWGCGFFVFVFLLGTIDYLNRIRREQRQLRDWAQQNDKLVNPVNREQSVPLEKIKLAELASPAQR